MMISNLFICLSLAAASLCANVVPLNFKKAKNSGPNTLAQRSTGNLTISQNISSSFNGAFYSTEVEIGTPPQVAIMVIDTGSSDTWVMGTSPENACVQSTNSACATEFEPTNSTTYHEIDDNGLDIEYGSGNSWAVGGFFEDSFTIGGVKIDSLQMGLSTNSSSDHQSGILGLGFDTNEAEDDSLTGETGNTYPSIVDTMVSQKLINTPAFSQWLDVDGKDGSGSLLFGGIDTDKFVGDLLPTPILPDTRESVPWYTFYFVNLTLVVINGEEMPVIVGPVVLDCGTTITYLPSAFVQQIAGAYGATWQPEFGLYTVDCNASTLYPNQYIEYRFASAGSGSNSPSIRVPISELVLDSENDLPATNSSEEPCWLGMAPSDGNGFFPFLGETFLRSAYVVYDLKNHEIGFAQVNTNSTMSSVVEIAADATTIPKLQGGSVSSSTAPTSSTAQPTSSAVATTNSIIAPAKSASASLQNEAPAFEIFGCLAAVLSGFLFCM